jgi:hypothetical protein
MLLALMGAMSATLEPPPDTAQVTTVTVTSNAAGQCHVGRSDPAINASIKVTFLVTDADATVEAKVYRDNVLKGTITTLSSSNQFIDTLTGWVENGTVSPFTSHYSYRVDVVVKATGTVVSTKTADQWVQNYGGCDPT